MFRSNNNLLHGISLRNTHHITPSTLVEYGADFAMVSSVRHPLVNARVYLDNDTSSRLIFMEQLAQPQFAMLSRFLC